MKLSTKDIVMSGLFAAITAVLAQIIIPFPGVPFTMQVFAVTLAGVILGPKIGFLSQFIYVLVGAIGMPVFAGFGGGLSVIAGPTGGFIITFPIMALLVGYVSYKFKGKAYIMISMVIAITVNYIVGAGQYSLVANIGFIEAITVTCLPFVFADLIKVTCATIVGITIRKRLNL
ncbi:MAG: biotin transporter BioY [Clostridium sp.]